ncbi:MAG: helix-turn-helix domain-containing protein [Polyangiaceae bacterium]|nr:helix-turn-helix domain-containing protein [Polyangiaceae bacterium]
MTPRELDLDERFPPPPSVIPPRGTKRVIAVGGGRGGVGKSVLTVNLAVYLAQLGRSVAVVDADVAGANLHVGLGLAAPPTPTREQSDAGEIRIVETDVPGLRLVGALLDPTSASSARAGRRSRWLQAQRQIDSDFVIVDLGAGVAPGTLDLFSAADVSLCVTVPEPPAIEATYTFLRALFLRRVRRALLRERFRLRVVERALSELPPLPRPPEVIEALERTDPALAELAAGELSRLTPRLVVNGTRVRSDLDLGPSMQAIAARFLGVDLEYVGHVEQDDAVWLTVRRRRPLLVDSPTSKGARLIERVARRVVAITATLEGRASLPPPGVGRQNKPNLYELLGLSRGASDEEVRRAFKRQRELFGVHSLPLVSILDEAGLRAEQARLQEAHDTLLEPNRRRAYDLSTFPDLEDDTHPRESRRAPSPEDLQLIAEVQREIHTTTEFTGSFLRRVRESQGLELAEIARMTKIAAGHLSALEEERWEDLPAPVYARGFVRELAKVLKLDPMQVDRTYSKRLREGYLALGRAPD